MSEEFSRKLAEMFGITSTNNEKWFAEFLKQFETSTERTKKMWEAAASDATNRTITTTIPGEPKREYKTHIGIDGDITNEFPSTVPDDNDVYWRHHKQMIDEAMATRKEIILRIIDVSGNTIRGMINPISISPVDLAKLIESFRKT